jgi:hypothetical protein
LLGHLPDPVTSQLLRHGPRNDAREIAGILKNSSPDIIRLGSVRGVTGGSPLTDIVETAVITAAVVPFIQAIATKAGEDSYQWLKQVIKAQAEGKSHGRHSLRGLTKRGQARRGAQASTSQNINYYVYDPDAMTLLIIPSSAQGDALHGLSNIDIADIRGKILIWSMDRRSWILADQPLGHEQTAIELNDPPQGSSGPDTKE